MSDETENVYIVPPTDDVVGFARWLSRRWHQAFEDLRQPRRAATSNWASLLGHPCLRHIYYKRTGAEETPISARAQAIFESGNEIERQTVNFMRTELELEWVRSQEGVPKDHLNIGSRIDGGIRGVRAKGDPYILAEVKRVNRQQWDKITDGDIQGIHDMLERCAWWIRKYPFQGAAYLHYFREHGLIFVLREPSSGWAKFVPMPADAPITLQLWDEIEQRATFINAAVEAEQVPDRMLWDKQVCGMCDFAQTACFPEQEHAGTDILDHPDLVAAAREFVDLKAMARRAEELKAYLREIAIQTDCDRVVIGDVLEAKVTTTAAGDKSVRISELEGSLFFGG